MMKTYRNNFTSFETSIKINSLENSAQMQKRLDLIKSGMKDHVFKSSPKNLLILVLIVLVGFPLLILLPPVGIPLSVFALLTFIKKLNKKKKMLTKAYIENFLQPVLDQILEDTKINYYKLIDDMDFLAIMFNHAQIYKGECNIVFGDEYKTEFSNLNVMHYREQKGENAATDDDFIGQVLRVKIPTKIKGHLRIIAKDKKKTRGKNLYGPYRGLYKDEIEVPTESIKFNKSYSIFSTDEFYAKLFLDPKIIDIFTNWIDKMKISLYMDENSISILYQSDKYLFPAPITEEEIDDLSLAGEYEKVRDQLADFYSLIDIIGEKF